MKSLIDHLKTIPAHEKRITISTALTLARIFLVPFIIGSMLNQAWHSAFLLFMCAAITDFLDGNLARWRNEKTFLGACLDPLADKWLLLTIFFTLAFVQTPLFSLPLWFVLFVLMKELVVIGGACFIYATRGSLEVRPTMLGKISTVIQMAFITWLFACYFFEWVPVKTYYAMLGGVMIVVGLSLMQYTRIGFYQLVR